MSAFKRDAGGYMGLKSLMSIVTFNALNGFSPQHTQQIEHILHHSMMVGMIAKQLARDIGGNHDQAFVCGLLYDLGRIVMLNMFSKYDLDKEKRDYLMRTHHETLGALLPQIILRSWIKRLAVSCQPINRPAHQP